MQEHYGQCRGAALLLHGGAGPRDPQGAELRAATVELQRIGRDGLAALTGGKDPLDVVTDCLVALESSAPFNAGRGAALQADGQARLTAALMDSRLGHFSGIISASYIEHPALLARALQTSSARVLTNPGAELLARQLGLPLADNLTPKRLDDWRRAWDRHSSQGRTLADNDTWGEGADTVGCVIRAADGTLYAGTSTGGRGFEFPGRVSDSATVAGTYCSEHCAVGATGVGEQIVDAALCARLETRRRDGRSLVEACRQSVVEAGHAGHRYGWIAVDREGFWAAVTTTETMAFVVLGAEEGEVAAS